MAQVPFMTEAKVWILVVAVLILAELRLVSSVLLVKKTMFFTVAVSVLTNITACYTAR